VPHFDLRTEEVPGVERTAMHEDGRNRPPAADLREIILGAQDNLINVLATVLGVGIGSGSTKIVALAGLASGIAEAISMGGVLYTSTCAERDLQRRVNHHEEGTVAASLKDPLRAALVTFVAAFVAAAIPLTPFVFLPIGWAMATAGALSVAALFALGGYKGSVTGRPWWRDGLQFVAIGALAAIASALVGTVLKTNAA
jgi:predicted membrane protein (TIGR00267 family)